MIRQYISKGECDIKTFFEILNYYLKYENYDELVIIKTD